MTSTIFFIGKPIFNDLVFNRKLPMAKKMIDLIEFKELKLLFVD